MVYRSLCVPVEYVLLKFYCSLFIYSLLGFVLNSRLPTNTPQAVVLMPILCDCLGPLASYFPHTNFTRVQERVIPAIIQNDFNVVVAAPTGSGKTALLEAAMLRLFKDRLTLNTVGSDAALPPNADDEVDAATGNKEHANSPTNRKAVYICPMKALAFEKYTQWRERFPALSVVMETGDQEAMRTVDAIMDEVFQTDIIITTPERWDGITRRWKEGVVWNLVASVALLMLDEVHTVSEERGAALEAVVSRMKAIKLSMTTRGPQVCRTRFVAISGTLPNIEDFAEVASGSPRRGIFVYISRPPSATNTAGGVVSQHFKHPFAFDRFLTLKLFGLIRRYSEGRPTLVFCASRGETMNSARRITEELNEAAAREGCERQLCASEEVQRLASSANDKQLRTMLLLGIAYHHAAMTANDRTLVERMFMGHYVSVICTTTTLALGVNLPAHLVIVKGTTFFKNGNRDDLPLSEIAQMSGRAGRPGLDTHGVALVLTTDDKAYLYKPLQHGDTCTTVESRLHQNMIEHVNAEVALRTIHNLSLGVEWIKTTFFWIRLRRCPRRYGIIFSTKQEEDNFDREQFADQLMRRMLAELEKQGCVAIGRDALKAGDVILNESATQTLQDRSPSSTGCRDVSDVNCAVESTRVGRAMARRYILFKTVETLNRELLHRFSHQSGRQGAPQIMGAAMAEEEGQIQQKTGESFTLHQVLRVFCHSSEFDGLRLRQGDKKHLNELNKVIRFPLNCGMRGGREVREDWHKVYVLIQAHLDRVAISDFSLRNDCVRLWTVAPRVARFVVDYATTHPCFSLIQQSSLLCRCIEQGTWWDGLIIKQIEGIGENMAKALHEGGIKNFSDVLQANPRKLEALCGKNPPFGTDLQEKCHSRPMYNLALEHVTEAGTVRVVVSYKAGVSTRRDPPLEQCHMILLVGDLELDRTHLLRQIDCRTANRRPLVFTFQVSPGYRGQIMGSLTIGNFLGNDCNATLKVGGVEAGDSVELQTATGFAQQPKHRTTAEKMQGTLKKTPDDVKVTDRNADRDSINEPVPHNRRSTEPFVTTPHQVRGDTSVITDQCASDLEGGEIGTTSAERGAHSAAVGCDDEATVVKTKMADSESSRRRDTEAGQTDEAFKYLLERKAQIASSMGIRVVSSPCGYKRRRENKENGSGDSSETRWSPQISCKEGDDMLLGGMEVVLPKTLSPPPNPVTDVGRGGARPSKRFRFNVQGVSPYTTVGRHAHYQGCYGDTRAAATHPIVNTIEPGVSPLFPHTTPPATYSSGHPTFQRSIFECPHASTPPHRTGVVHQLRVTTNAATSGRQLSHVGVDAYRQSTFSKAECFAPFTWGPRCVANASGAFAHGSAPQLPLGGSVACFGEVPRAEPSPFRRARPTEFGGYTSHNGVVDPSIRRGVVRHTTVHRGWW
ncbi:DEAD/DEAH box helicase, putative [Trypanosoma brucei gambiense DAL972]|uniref:DNA 3'-5' helicase n=2 Tax=Trypanosoma brucei TaxID=5691 RepID=D0AA21_TRYB9|nr:LOW QUALITY PROTEIN: DEAD/DEAH box helicase, putative [Trypanosoma brucei gambiense DAL972]CBH18522.1 DEAD/DEAH box helicase, putative [Trypanosoma brucei gambiense DAL972]|eukprot:XP_011780786.1 LOW QUALITY PROTEIN: DEAD/DEAH box helicase, putative [Trypanosoma brucei gambiense DAL972]